MSKQKMCSKTFWKRTFWALVFLNLIVAIIRGLTHAPYIDYQSVSGAKPTIQKEVQPSSR